MYSFCFQRGWFVSVMLRVRHSYAYVCILQGPLLSEKQMLVFLGYLFIECLIPSIFIFFIFPWCTCCTRCNHLELNQNRARLPVPLCRSWSRDHANVSIADCCIFADLVMLLYLCNVTHGFSTGLLQILVGQVG